MKFITKDIDYTGCHPDIANSLKQGKAIKCKVYLEGAGQCSLYCIGYNKSTHRYFGEDGWEHYNPEPIQVKRILKDPVSIMKILVEEGWVFLMQDDEWFKDSCKIYIDWNDCGKSVKLEGIYPDNFYTYKE